MATWLFIFAAISGLADLIGIVRVIKASASNTTTEGESVVWLGREVRVTVGKLLSFVGWGVLCFVLTSYGMYVSLGGRSAARPHIIIDAPEWGMLGDSKNPRASTGCFQNELTDHIVTLKDRYYLYVACGANDPMRDKYDDTRIVVSSPFNITGGKVDISIRWTKEFAASTADIHANGIWQQAFLLPREISAIRVTKLSDVRALGGLLPGDEVPMK